MIFGNQLKKRQEEASERPHTKKDQEESKTHEAEDQYPLPAPVTEADVSSEGSFTAKDTKHRLVVNVGQTEYDVVKKVARRDLNWRLKYYQEDHDGAIRNGERNQKLSPLFDLTWHDLTVTADFLTKLNPWQKVNMYPGIACISRKNYLARNLMRMHKAYPEDYNFFPKTWVLPNDSNDFRNCFTKNLARNGKKKTTYIVKPDGMS